MWWGKMFSTVSCLSELRGHLFWLEFLRLSSPLDSEVTPGFFLDASTNHLSVIMLPLYAVLSWPGPQWMLQCIKGQMCFMAMRYWYSRASGDPLEIQQSSLLRKAVFLKKIHSNYYFCESWGLWSQDHRAGIRLQLSSVSATCWSCDLDQVTAALLFSSVKWRE